MRWMRGGQTGKTVEPGKVAALATADVHDIEEIRQRDGQVRLKVVDDPLPEAPDHALIRLEPEGQCTKGEIRIMRNELLKKFEIAPASDITDSSPPSTT